MGLYSLSNKKGCASDHQIPGVPAKENIGQIRFRAAVVLGMFVTRPEVCIFAPKTTCSQQSAISPWNGSCNIFAPGHTKCIDYMLGSHNFSKMCAERPSTYSPTTIVVDSPDCPLPAADAAMLCLRAFLNRFGILGLFQPREITVVFQHHVYGKQSSGSGSYAAVNMVCACASWTTEDAGTMASERLFQSAFRVLPGILTETPDTVSIGALLLMVTYLVSTSRSSTAANVFGSAVQMILLAGYHTTPSSLGDRSAQDLQKTRLLYRAYILEQDLSLRLGKPPLLNESMIACLPNERPDDRQGIICLPGGTTVNYLRERVVLARIQNRAWEALRSPVSSTKSSKEFLISSNQLIGELEQWNKSLPTSIRPPEMPAEPSALQQMQLEEIHLSYFQNVVVIYFTRPSSLTPPSSVILQCATRQESQWASAQLQSERCSLWPSALTKAILWCWKMASDAIAIMYKVAKEAVAQPHGLLQE
ncbi:transcriptional regulatory protein [Diaporthe eres]|nr:transcriptional regulatory protein [Diaporthe eres]